MRCRFSQLGDQGLAPVALVGGIRQFQYVATRILQQAGLGERTFQGSGLHLLLGRPLRPRNALGGDCFGVEALGDLVDDALTNLAFEGLESLLVFEYLELPWIAGIVSELGHLVRHRYATDLAALEERHQLVIVRLADWVELMVMAACATQGQAEERLASHVYRVNQPLVTQLVAVESRFVIHGAHGVETRADAGLQMTLLLLRNVVGSAQFDVVGPDLVGCHLLPHELVEGFVVVEGLDHVVPVAPGVREVDVGFEPSRVGVAHRVQPVAPPALAVALRVQKPIDCILERLGRRILDERSDFLRGGRKPVQVVSRPPDPSPAIGFANRF